MAGVLTGALTPGAPLTAQEPPEWSTLQSQIAIDVSSGDGGAEVSIRYELGARESGAPLPLESPIGLGLLGFADATTDEIRVGGRRVALWPTVGSHRAAVIQAPAPERGDSTVWVYIAYRIDRALVDEGAGDGVALRARVPIVAGPAVRADAGPSAFAGQVTVPRGWVLTESFPSGVRPVSETVYAVSLPVVPALVSFRARTDGVWRPGFPLLIDVLTVLILATFAGFGWRHLRRVAA